ncbi:MAG: hypothetical protein QOE37_2374 [Microbacteriaceae bacterium]|nr:hypothetical protein [Microbacteriaceae bacterium]
MISTALDGAATPAGSISLGAWTRVGRRPPPNVIWQVPGGGGVRAWIHRIWRDSLGTSRAGREARPLVPGAASLVLRRDGTADVGAWGSEVRMSPEVASVRQNLVPLVEGGRLNPTCATGGTAEWGSTVGQAAYIHRSGFGVTARGAGVYVGGPLLFGVQPRGDSALGGGGAWYRARHQSRLGVRGLLPAAAQRPADSDQAVPLEQIGAQHYLQRSSRDFFAWYLRATERQPP